MENSWVKSIWQAFNGLWEHEEIKKKKKKEIWSDETNIEHFNLNFRHYVQWKQDIDHQLANTIPPVKHGCGSIMLCRYFSVAGTGQNWGINAAKYRDAFEENLPQGAHNLSLGWRFTFQHMSLSGTAKVQNICEPRLQRDLKVAVYKYTLSNLTEIERICQEEWSKNCPVLGVQSLQRLTHEDLTL